MPIRHGGYWPAVFRLTSRPLLTQHQGAVPIQTDDMERVLANINADDGDLAQNLGHGVPHHTEMSCTSVFLAY